MLQLCLQPPDSPCFQLSVRPSGGTLSNLTETQDKESPLRRFGLPRLSHPSGTYARLPLNVPSGRSGHLRVDDLQTACKPAFSNLENSSCICI